jgi:hypothetical protein
MKIHALAIGVLMASEVSAFVPASSRTARKLKGASENKPLHMADEYNFDNGTPKTVTSALKGLVNGDGNAARLEKLKADLQREIAQAEADRIKVLQEIAEAEARRGRLQEEATKVGSEVEARRKRLTALEEQAARASAGGLLGGAAAPVVVVGGLGAIAAAITAARSALAAREKVLEEKKQEAEEARLAAEKVEGKAGGLAGIVVVSILCLCLLRF